MAWPGIAEFSSAIQNPVRCFCRPGAFQRRAGGVRPGRTGRDARSIGRQFRCGVSGIQPGPQLCRALFYPCRE